MNGAVAVSVTDIWMLAKLAGRECDSQEQLKTEVVDFLTRNNLDGLSNGDDCGCTLGSLGHCGKLCDGCRAGKFRSCSNCCLCRDNGEELHWRFGDCIDSAGCVNVVRLPIGEVPK